MSLGFSCGVKEGRSQWTDEKSGQKKFSTYKELTITGHKICEIPTLLPRKKLVSIENETKLLRSKSFMGSKFNLLEVGVGPYVGWQLHDKRGRFCLQDGTAVHNTPEGASVGIVKNLAYMSHVTISSNSMPIYEYIMPHIIDIQTLTPLEMFEKTKVFVNGAWIGITESPTELYNMLKDKKYKGIINVYAGIIFDYKLNEIRVCNDGGRITRPILRVKDKNILVTSSIINKLNKNELIWDDLLTDCKVKESVVEYIDPEEQAWSMIAMKPEELVQTSDADKIFKYTHCEIHPSTIFGVLASCIPFPEHNQSPRNTYQCAQAKQAMGMYVTNFDTRMDKTAYVLSNPARPLVDTRIMDMIQINKIPSGFNAVVAIMSHTGYNQEDSLLFNKASIDRGLFQATIYHTEKDEDKQKINGDEEIRCKPDANKTKGMKFANYNKVNGRGVIPENTRVENRDVIISKVTPIKENRNDHTKVIKYEDQSRIYRTDEETYVDKNYIDRNGDGYNFAKVRIRAVRKPVIGDKFSSRSGQKGTLGNLIPEQDMPFTRSGLRPDLILNPHAIPSRMTIAQLKETILGKTLIELGLFGDGTSFGELNVKTICQKLQEVGYESNGNEIMYDALTGEQMECTVFLGPVFYQRLKHMVTDKQHSRSIGPMVNLTRQPAEGRSRDGGLRFGEMERDCMISHGASRFTRGRMYDASDKYQVHVCKKCGLIASYNDQMHIHHCRTCDNRTDFAYVEIPYACKLLFQELITMNIAPRVITNY
jgi:DNA-directed RNA polymerase II subunit RPB2